ncbi:hypothetical protein DOTSEDRAFT_177777 [Dothistroma septosporum NZE10]|uniref:Uncharacterized protein n=1 Tax=Dothistroma septosporum (strain NZE10 / CBS 128990) TaxID=675120 RepID=N1PH81_DOTSN|nr:hypothetical protein DOTSEDRAFT_177777 [Dothistroma septosporum NZE10]
MSTSPHQPAMDRGSRRGSWARAFDKVRAAMKRQTSSSRPLTATAPVAPDAADRDMSHTVATITETGAAATPGPQTSSHPLMLDGLPPAIQPADQLLAAETGIEVDSDDDREEPLLPIMSSRTGVGQDKARELFAKYSLQYEGKGKRAVREPPTKIRRVEKAVRLRVHWTCHECRTQFGIEKTCVECGHRRCTDCTRHPPKRVKQISDDARAHMETENRSVQEPRPASLQEEPEESPPAIDRDLEHYQQEPSAAPQVVLPEQGEASRPKDSPRTSAAAVPGHPSLRPLELDDDPEDNAHLSMTTIECSLYTRSRPGVQTILKPKVQLLRRTCHKCEIVMSSPSQTDCSNCGHIRCGLCPRYPPTHQKWPSQLRQLSHDEAPMVRTVRRVYRKPRQRVRYTCEHCYTLFVDTDRCTECGHERCRSCHREPPKRAPVVHDPEVLQAVANRLAGYGGFDRPRQSIAASAG